MEPKAAILVAVHQEVAVTTATVVYRLWLTSGHWERDSVLFRRKRRFGDNCVWVAESGSARVLFGDAPVVHYTQFQLIHAIVTSPVVVDVLLEGLRMRTVKSLTRFDRTVTMHASNHPEPLPAESVNRMLFVASVAFA